MDIDSVRRQIAAAVRDAHLDDNEDESGAFQLKSSACFLIHDGMAGLKIAPNADGSITLERPRHITEGRGDGHRSRKAKAHDGRGMTSYGRHWIEAQLRLLRFLIARDDLIRQADLSPLAPPAWAFTMHVVIMDMMRHAGLDPQRHIAPGRIGGKPSESQLLSDGIGCLIAGSRKRSGKRDDYVMKRRRIAYDGRETQRLGTQRMRITEVAEGVRILLHGIHLPATIAGLTDIPVATIIELPQAYSKTSALSVNKMTDTDEGTILHLPQSREFPQDSPKGIDRSSLEWETQGSQE